MKKTVLFTLLFIAKIGICQLVDHIPAKEANFKNFPNLYSFFNKSDQGIFHTEITEKGKQKIFVLERYNNDLSCAFRRELNFEEKEENSLFEIVNNKIYFFSTVYDGKDKILFLIILDNVTGKILTDKKKLSSLPSDPFGTHGRNFSIAFSPDKSKILIVSSFQWPKKAQVVKAELYDFESMKIIYTVDLPDNYNNIMIKSRNFFITNEGNIFFTIKTDTKEKGVPQKESVSLYDTKTKSFRYLELPFDKKIIENSTSFKKDGMFFWCGIFKDDYTKKDDKENKAGVFCISADINSLKINTSDFNYFSADIEARLTYKDGKKKKDLSEKEYTFKKLVTTANGFYLVENLSYTAEIQGSSTTVYKPYSREFIVSKFNNIGKLEFVKTLPKNTTNKMYDSDIMESEGSLFLFYCEHPKNLEKYTLENFDPKEYNDIGDLRGPVAVCVKVDEKGNLFRQELFTNETWCYWPGTGIILNKGKEMVVMEIQKDEYTLGVFKVKK